MISLRTDNFLLKWKLLCLTETIKSVLLKKIVSLPILQPLLLDIFEQHARLHPPSYLSN